MDLGLIVINPCQIYDLHPSTHQSVSPSYLSVWTQGYLFYYLGYYCCLCFWSNFSSFGHWYLFFFFLSDWFLCPENHASPFLNTSFLSGTTICSRLIFYFSCPSPVISYLCKEPWFFFIKEWYLAIDIWVLGVLIATGCHCFIFHI